jgi:tyrosyl-tRNA synthetase
MRDYGVHFSVNELIKKDIYRERLEREEGLTVFELNYILLQSYDFLHLFRKYNCTIQLGAQDQWSNILGGVDLIRKCEQAESYAIVSPLLVRSDGKKMGKSEGGAIWLDKNKTSSYELYQYFINIPDADVSKFMNIFTFVESVEIERLINENINNAKKVLAFEVVKFVHSEADAQEAKEKSEKIFEEGDLDNAPEVTVPKELLTGEKIHIADILVAGKVLESKGKVKELLAGGGLQVNNQKIETLEIDNPTLAGSELVVRIGKKKYYKIISE